MTRMKLSYSIRRKSSWH